MPTIGHLSGSTDGAAIQIAATATAGTTVHTSVAATDQIEMVHLFAANNHTNVSSHVLVKAESAQPLENAQL